METAAGCCPLPCNHLVRARASSLNAVWFSSSCKMSGQAYHMLRSVPRSVPCCQAGVPSGAASLHRSVARLHRCVAGRPGCAAGCLLHPALLAPLVHRNPLHSQHSLRLQGALNVSAVASVSCL